MSKERELLKKIWEDLDGDRDNYNLLCEEIEELLAQPDALAQVIEVRDIQGRDGNFDQDDYMRGIYSGLELAVSIFEDREPSYKELLAQPEQAEQEPLPPKNLLIEKCDAFLRSLIENNGEGLKELKAFDPEIYNKLIGDFWK